jgi:hypothetical protein
VKAGSTDLHVVDVGLVHLVGALLGAAEQVEDADVARRRRRQQVLLRRLQQTHTHVSYRVIGRFYLFIYWHTHIYNKTKHASYKDKDKDKIIYLQNYGTLHN